MKRNASLIAAAFAVTALFSVTSDAAASETLVLKRHTFRDPGSRNIPSHTVYAPEGWSAEGGAFWANQAFFRILPSQRVVVKAPDGRMAAVYPTLAAIENIPSAEMQRLGIRQPADGGADSGYLVLRMPKSKQEWIAWVEKNGIKTPYPGATNIRCRSFEVVPELAQTLQKQIEPIRRQMEQENRQKAAFGSPERAYCGAIAYAARFTYEHDGKEWEQLWVWGTGYLIQDTQVGRQIMWNIEPNTTFRAPAGQLNDALPTLITVVNSVRMTPEWARMKAKHIARMRQIDIEHFVEMSEIQGTFSRDMRKIINRGYDNRQAARDAGHDRFIRALRETEIYRVPGSSHPAVELPMHYKHVWTSDSGKIVLTNNANYNPGIGSTDTWRQMERVRN